MRITNIDAIDGSHIGKILSTHINLFTTNLDTIDGSALLTTIIGNICSPILQIFDGISLPCCCLLQRINSLRICLRLFHRLIDVSQCGCHALAINDLPSHLQRARVHGSTGNRASTDGSHTGQLHTVLRELRGLLLQIGDLAFIRGDTFSSGLQITLICFSSKRVIQIIPLILQVSYVFHQSFGSIPNLGFKSCYFPLYDPYAFVQSCNRILIRLGVQRCRIRFCIELRPCRIPSIRSYRINFLVNSSFNISYIGSVCRDLFPLIRCRILQSCDIVLVIINVCLFTIFFQQIINLICRINFF